MQQNNYNTIANQTPYEGGDAVYTARIMIGFEPDEHGVAYRLQKQDDEIKTEDLVLYPNPAKDVLYIEVMSKLDNYNAIIKIYNTIGQLVAEQQMTQKMEFINLKTLKTGMYIYNISYDNGFTEKGKFIIQQ